MAHDVFISHSARDKPFADAVCAKLESRGMRCWIAPRDIRAGMEWGAAILEAIGCARVMLLLFSSHANASPQIRREVERAVNRELVIVPVRVEDVKPTGNLEYFLGTPHWLDAITQPFEQHLDHIADSVKFWLDRFKSDGTISEAPRPTQPDPDRPSAQAAPHVIASARSRRVFANWQTRVAVALVAVAAFATAAFLGARHNLGRQPLGNETEGAAAAQTAQAISVAMPEVFDQIGERVAAQDRTPGFAFLVQYQGKVLFSRGYGLADIEEKTAVTPDTRFAIGSISKQFVAASILLLEQRGKLSLGDRLSTWLPQLPNANKITLGMLLYHASGLHDFPYTDEHKWPLHGAISPGKIFDILATDKPDFNPGTRSVYNNTDYAALAGVVSRVSGKSYSEFLKTNIFAPLQMSDSGNGYEAQKAGIAVPYTGIGSFVRQDGLSLDLYYGAGSIVSTVVDLAKWDQALLSGSLLGPASIHNLWTPGILADGKTLPYGMGFIPTTLHGRYEVWHDGYVPHTGGYCLNAIFPDDQLAIVVLSNGKEFQGQAEQIVHQVFESVLPVEDPAVSALVKKIFSQVRQGGIDKSLMTGAMNEVFSSQTVMNNYAALGDLQELVFEEKSSENGGTSFSSGDRHVEIFIESDGKVAAYKIGP